MGVELIPYDHRKHKVSFGSSLLDELARRGARGFYVIPTKQGLRPYVGTEGWRAIAAEMVRRAECSIVEIKTEVTFQDDAPVVHVTMTVKPRRNGGVIKVDGWGYAPPESYLSYRSFGERDAITFANLRAWRILAQNLTFALFPMISNATLPQDALNDIAEETYEDITYVPIEEETESKEEMHSGRIPRNGQGTGGNGQARRSGNGQTLKRKTPTDFWRKVKESNVPEDLARCLAEEAIATGNWNAAIEKLDRILAAEHNHVSKEGEDKGKPIKEPPKGEDKSGSVEELPEADALPASLVSPSVSDRKATSTDFWRKAKREVLPKGVPPVEVQQLAKEATRTGDWDTAIKKLDELLSHTLFGTNR